MSNYSQLDPVHGDDEEKESEIIHNAEPSDLNDKQLTEQTLKEFDTNYAISQLLNERGCLHQTNVSKDDNINNANFAIPEYVNEYNMEEDDDEESFMDINGSWLNGSIGSDVKDNKNHNDEHDNILSVLSPTVSSLSSIDYDHSDNIQSSPDSEITYQSKIDNQNDIRSILPKINDEIPSGINQEKTEERKPKKSRISSIFSAFSSKKKNNKKKRSNSVDLKMNKYDKHENMDNASRIIEKGTVLNNMNKGSRKKTPQQFHI